MSEPKYKLPFKSVAVTLLFCVILGPIGLLYSSALGGSVMILFALFIICSPFHMPIILVWLGSCIWGVIAANKYNKKLLEKM